MDVPHDVFAFRVYYRCTSYCVAHSVSLVSGCFWMLLLVVATGVVAPRTASASRAPTALAGKIAEADLSKDQLEIKKISDKWNTVRLWTREEAEKLEPEWKEAYDRFHEKYEADMKNMVEVAARVKTMIEPPQVQKKTKGQRKRDKWAIVQSRAAARAIVKK
jgi:hypothetical protein